MTSKIRLIITDLDNTLYNWVDFYVPSFLAMLETIHRISGVDEETLKASLKKVHETHRTSEYAFAIEELEILRKVEVGRSSAEILQKYWPAVEIFRQTRKKTLTLYPAVRSTLKTLRAQGRQIVAHTDSIGFYAFRRLRSLGIEELFDGICAPADHGFPKDIPLESLRTQPAEQYKTLIPVEIPLRPELRKPNPDVLRTILTTFAVEPAAALFIGDSIGRDVVMAQECGVLDVYAKYGNEYDPAHYEQLKKITYWTDAEIKREAQARPRTTKPSFTIDSFPDLLEIIKSIESTVSV